MIDEKMLIERLEEEKSDWNCDYNVPINKAIEIVKDLAEEHNNNVIIDEQYCWQTCGSTEHCKECNRLSNGDIDYYENYDFMVEEHNNGWIPCSERLPKENQNVIACFARGSVTELGFYDGLFHGIYDYNTKVILAWQPLPAPYRKGE